MELAEETWGILASPPHTLTVFQGWWHRWYLIRRARRVESLSHQAWSRRLVEEMRMPRRQRDFLVCWEEFDCPTCGATAGHKCVSRISGKLASEHVARVALRREKYGSAEVRR